MNNNNNYKTVYKEFRGKGLPLSMSRKRLLDMYLNRIIKNTNLKSSNWKQKVYAWNGLNKSVNKNKIIKNTELKRLLHFTKQNKLPANWKTQILKWPNVNNKNKNEIIKSMSKAKPKSYVKSLRNTILPKVFTLQNVKNYTDPVTGIKHSYIELPNGSKMNVNQINISSLKNLKGEGILRGINYEVNKKLHASLANRGRNVFTYTRAYKNLPNVKNFINTIAMMNKIYHPTNYKYKRIVSDIFASTYRLLKVLPSKFNEKYPHVSFITRHIRERSSNKYNPIYLETIGDDNFEKLSNFNAFVRKYKKLFMNTKVLHVSEKKREQIWNTIENWKGTMAMCIATCNQIYYGANRSPRRSVLNF